MHLEPLTVLTSDEHNPNVAFSGDRLILIGGGGLEVWDVATHARVHHVRGFITGDTDDAEAFPGEGEPHGFRNLRVSPDGCTAISWGGLRNVTVWHLDAGHRGARFFHAEGAEDVAAAVFVGDAVVSSAHVNNTYELAVWDTASGALRTRLAHPPLGATADEFAACADCIEARREWQDDDEMCRKHTDLAEHDCGSELVLHPDGHRLVSGGRGLCAWDLDRGWLGTMSPTGSVTHLSIPTSGHVYAISEDRAGRALHIWREVLGERIAKVPILRPSQPVRAILPGPSTILLNTQLAAELHDLDGARLASFEPPHGNWLAHPDGEHIVHQNHLEASPRQLIVSRIRDGHALHAVEVPDGWLRAMSATGLVSYVVGQEVHLFQLS